MGIFDEFDSRARGESAIDRLSGKISEPGRVSAAAEPITQSIGVWKIAFGVLAGNLMTGIVGAIIYAMFRN